MRRAFFFAVYQPPLTFRFLKIRISTAFSVNGGNYIRSYEFLRVLGIRVQLHYGQSSIAFVVHKVKEQFDFPVPFRLHYRIRFPDILHRAFHALDAKIVVVDILSLISPILAAFHSQVGVPVAHDDRQVFHFYARFFHRGSEAVSKPAKIQMSLIERFCRVHDIVEKFVLCFPLRVESRRIVGNIRH